MFCLLRWKSDVKSISEAIDWEGLVNQNARCCIEKNNIIAGNYVGRQVSLYVKDFTVTSSCRISEYLTHTHFFADQLVKQFAIHNGAIQDTPCSDVDEI